jgi:hypothetical protein
LPTAQRQKGNHLSLRSLRWIHDFHGIAKPKPKSRDTILISIRFSVFYQPSLVSECVQACLPGFTFMSAHLFYGIFPYGNT